MTSSLILVFIIFTIGYLGQRTLQLSIQSFSTVIVYLLAPFVIFRILYHNPLSGDFGFIVFFCLVLLILLIGCSYLWSRAVTTSLYEQKSIIIASSFMNSANFGAPLLLFALGEKAFELAVFLMLVQTILLNTVGASIATFNSSYSLTLKQLVIRFFKIPMVYSAFFAIGVTWFALELPYNLIRAIDLIADASIPLLMLVFGMQLATLPIKKKRTTHLYSLLFLRLILSPILAIGLVYWLPISPLVKAVCILQAAMPVAPNTILFSNQMNEEASIISNGILFTTLGSFFSLHLVFLFIQIWIL